MSMPIVDSDIESKLLNAANFLSLPLRESFYIAIIAELSPGEGRLHRALSRAQRQFLRAAPLIPDGAGSGHVRHGSKHSQSASLYRRRAR